MIRFVCPGCSAGLRVAPDKSGKLIRCPSCGRVVRAPEPRPGEVEDVEELPVVEDEEEEEELEQVESVEGEEEEPEEERPRRRRRDDDEDDEDDEPLVIRGRRAPRTDEDGPVHVVTWNRFMGVVGVVLGVGFFTAAVIAGATGVSQLVSPMDNPAGAAGCGALLLGLAMIVVGAFYIYRG